MSDEIIQKKRISIHKNMILMMIYRIVVTVTPLITTPYVSRVLSPESIGSYSYTQSICAYFGTVAALGATIYGQREIAYTRDDRRKCSKTFWEIMAIRTFCAVVSIGIYILAIFLFFEQEMQIIFLIQIMDLIAGVLDISWLYYGLEIFSKVFLKNLFLKMMTVVCIFALVKGKSDIYLYIGINSAALILSNLVFWKGILRYISLVDIREFEIKKHIPSMLTIFLPSVASTLYNKVDITMLGTLSESSVETAYYSQTVKIITICESTVATVGSVLAPRLAYVFQNGNQNELRQYFLKGIDALCTIGIPVTCGMMIIADSLIPWFLGDIYRNAIPLLQMMSPLCLLACINSYIGVQYLVATKRQNQYTALIIVGTIANVVCNFFMIPLKGSQGAVIASLGSELLILSIALCIIWNEISLPQIIRILSKKIYAVMVMCFCVQLSGMVMLNVTVLIFLKIAVGCVAYIGMLLLLKEKLLINFMKKFYRW